MALMRMVRFIKPYRLQVAGALILLLFQVAFDLSIPRLTQRIIDQGVLKRDLNVIVPTSLFMLGMAVISAGFAVANTMLSVRVGQNTGTDIRSALVRKVQTFSFGNLDRLQTGQLLVRATSDISQVQMIVQMSLRVLTRAPLWIVGSLTMLFLTNATLGWMMLLLSASVLILTWTIGARAQPLFVRVQQKLDRLNQVLQENLGGVRVVRAFVREEHEKERFGRANDELTDQTIRVMQIMALLIPTMQLALNLGIVGAVWLGGQSVIGGDLALGKLVASINYITNSMFPLTMLGTMIGPLSAAQASAGRILEVLDIEADVQERSPAQPMAPVRGHVDLEDVSFGYNGAAVLKNVTLTAWPGETVAILGATGAGKSTLINLIPRFYDVGHGRVMLDGVDVRDMPLDQLRQQFGIALQEVILFTGSIRDNIRYGRPLATDEEVVAAAQAAQAHDFITSFPDGYDTMVGERGVNLSGGQKQRIAIARALLMQPKVLILDDSTSSVDVETESKIQGALERLMSNCTSFVVTQRISTVLNADKIVVLDQGQVSAVGAHDELIKNSPIYQEIYQSQLGDGHRAWAGSETIGRG